MTDPRFPVLLTATQWRQALKARCDWQRVHREALGVLTCDSTDLIANARLEGGADRALTLLGEVGDYLKWRKSETRLLKEVRWRLATALRESAEPDGNPTPIHEETDHGHS